MARDLLIGLDAGTSMIKAVAFDLAGRQLAAAATPNAYRRDPGGRIVEQDLEETWERTARTLGQLAEALPDLAGRTAALGVTGQGDGTWLIDAAGRPVAPAWLWLDTRAAPVVEELAASGARAALGRLTGCGLNASNQSGQLVWLKRHRPELLERAATAFHCKDWLYFRMTGRRATDPTEGVFTFGDWRRRGYAAEALALLGLEAERRLLPEILDGTRAHDPLAAEAAAALGLPAGTPVVLGYVDVICSALGGGLHAPEGRAAVSLLGSTGMHMTLGPSEAIRPAEPANGYLMAFPVPGRTAQMQSNMAGTLNIDWLVGLVGEAAALAGGAEPATPELLAALDGRVLAARPGAALYHPYIDRAGERGPFFDARARAQFFGLSNAVGLGELARTVYEGLCFAARDCYDAMSCRPDEVRVAGGGARSRALRGLLASVLGLPVRESLREEQGAAGVAMIAGVAVGALADMDEACRRWVEPALGERLLPDPALAARYDGLYALYRELRAAAPPHWAALAALDAAPENRQEARSAAKEAAS
ncbi:erythritol kinase (L-erythritol 4-phosphate-forming) [Tistlia consotensis]|uniref:Erythritol kinase (L-erythritol 4-phosphate-forming) n=1 Tax=Tistlia consotensis USBA 355 TaxID=560819 RepID=A0A1Y6BPR4_9PROT|nr:FGGY-family carbohydrate kinase [Tistlia consotensis]SMF21916.1 erythritol kinase (L-erythritol 4-phosphate-forming) [Tistlia consotensis USBA 355]SNR46453.1 erythritol kinase (L-erythritol 4-phosphate-forming) [Tistlia consotensis]